MEIIHNTEQQRFYIEQNNAIAELNYRIHDGSLYLMKTVVSESLSRKGIGGQLIKNALKFAELKQYKVAVLCSFSRSYLKSNSELSYALDKTFHKNGL